MCVRASQTVAGVGRIAAVEEVCACISFCGRKETGGRGRRLRAQRFSDSNFRTKTRTKTQCHYTRRFDRNNRNNCPIIYLLVARNGNTGALHLIASVWGGDESVINSDCPPPYHSATKSEPLVLNLATNHRRRHRRRAERDDLHPPGVRAHTLERISFMRTHRITRARTQTPAPFGPECLRQSNAVPPPSPAVAHAIINHRSVRVRRARVRIIYAHAKRMATCVFT